MESKLISSCFISDYSLITNLHIYIYERAELVNPFQLIVQRRDYLYLITLVNSGLSRHFSKYLIILTYLLLPLLHYQNKYFSKVRNFLAFKMIQNWVDKWQICEINHILWNQKLICQFYSHTHKHTYTTHTPSIPSTVPTLFLFRHIDLSY